MPDDIEVAVSNDAVAAVPIVVGPEANIDQDGLAIINEDLEDSLPEGASLDAVMVSDTEAAGEDEAGDITASGPAPARREAVVEEPYEFDRCTIQIGLQLLPDDGDPAGRAVVIGVRNHADAPIVALTRLATLGPLPQIVIELLDRLRTDLPMRYRASEEAAARKKAEEETARARREAARSKSKVSNAKPTKKVNALDQAPESGMTPSSMPVVAAPTFDAPQVSEQISLF